MYIIEFKKNKLKSFHLDKISIRYEFSKKNIFVMFKMKYLINRMQYNILSQQVGWFDGKMFASILKVK